MVERNELPHCGIVAEDRGGVDVGRGDFRMCAEDRFGAIERP
jgi:hypothetical protein